MNNKRKIKKKKNTVALKCELQSYEGEVPQKFNTQYTYCHTENIKIRQKNSTK
jgi:hypothetical protein